MSTSTSSVITSVVCLRSTFTIRLPDFAFVLALKSPNTSFDNTIFLALCENDINGGEREGERERDRPKEKEEGE